MRQLGIHPIDAVPDQQGATHRRDTEVLLAGEPHRTANSGHCRRGFSSICKHRLPHVQDTVASIVLLITLGRPVSPETSRRLIQPPGPCRPAQRRARALHMNRADRNRAG